MGLSRNKTVELIEDLHKVGSREMEYESILKKCPEKAEDVNKWLFDIYKEINSLKTILSSELPYWYRRDILGRYLIRINTTGSSGGKPTGWGLQLFHVTNIYLTHKGSPWHEDYRMSVNGESFIISTDGKNNIDFFKYYKQTDEFEGTPGYLDSNCLYNIEPETLNEWKEIKEEDYKKVFNKCMAAIISHETLDLEELKKYSFDIIFEEDEKVKED